MITAFALAAVLLGSGGPAAHGAPARPAAPAADPIRVVTTLPVYGEIVKEIGGSQVIVTSIADPNEDPHFVRPKPSFALELRRADAFVTTGLDLELWVPTLLDKAGNTKVIEGGKGYITTYPGIKLLQVPTSTDRSAGDVHIYGNPHLTTDPLRTLQVARNITAGLKQAAPDQAATWQAGLEAFQDKIWNRLFGEQLVGMVGGAALEQLALQGQLFGFLDAQEFQGKKLRSYLGGWLGKGEAFRGRKVICYHKNWAYFQDRFGVTCADYVEPKPGIPPTPGHVAELIDEIRNQHIHVLFVADYFDKGKVQSMARRSGATMVRVPMEPGGKKGVDTYFDVVDTWVNGLATAFQGTR